MIKVSQKHNIFFQYLSWHFFDAAKNILGAFKNFLQFNLNYFSIPLLLRTFFSPWRRYQFSYGKKFRPIKYFEVFTFNLMSRSFGAVFRTFLILIGLLLQVFIFVAEIVTFLIWLILPVLLIIGLIYGFKLILF